MDRNYKIKKIISDFVIYKYHNDGVCYFEALEGAYNHFQMNFWVQKKAEMKAQHQLESIIEVLSIGQKQVETKRKMKYIKSRKITTDNN